MSVKGDEVSNTHIAQFFQSVSTIQGLTAGSSVLSALVEEGHDNVDTTSLAFAGCDNTFQILIVIIGRHVVRITVHFIGNTVVADINENKYIFTADTFAKASFCFAGTETGNV